METNTVRALFRYFEALYGANQSLIVLCGIDAIDHRGLYEKYLENVIQVIPRLVPYRFNKKTSHYELDENSGLLKFSDDIKYLKSDYTAILQTHGDFLERTKKIRNKLEHEMHGASIVASISGSNMLFMITYDVSGTEIDLNATEMISFMKDMNTLFSKIQNEIDHYSDEKKIWNHPYLQKLSWFDFMDFNKIYESDLLHTFGKAMLPF